MLVLAIDVISALRRLSMLGRIVIITTLTKQAITSILELTQPANDSHGNPFIPIRACIVDTTPRSFGFEIVMSMERRTMRNLLKASTASGVNNNAVGLANKSKQEAEPKFGPGGIVPTFKKGPATKFVKNIFKPKPGVVNKEVGIASKIPPKRPFPNEFDPTLKKFKPLDKYGNNIFNNCLINILKCFNLIKY